eukprot:CAMPEP_0178396358 /NCGR_PEP_ID=MMETSP0689_2-20121128/13688_1 /TAXON_ID=160604 /ORGANISM="Amphidinium massartii, Strain CS-259" /LENGTH=123 /DNA_ID=CAMNT_0020017031 /DNA_START=176 /DNA_END=546 /DNA_ORIENTATION=+
MSQAAHTLPPAEGISWTTSFASALRSLLGFGARIPGSANAALQEGDDRETCCQAAKGSVQQPHVDSEDKDVRAANGHHNEEHDDGAIPVRANVDDTIRSNFEEMHSANSDMPLTVPIQLICNA